MGKVSAILRWVRCWLLPDRRSNWENKRERQFIDAVNRLKNVHVSDRGGLSINPEELRDQILESRQQLKHLVDPAHRRSVAPNPSARPMPPENNNDARDEFRQFIIWRCHGDRAFRYVCLQRSEDERFSVAYAECIATEPELVERPIQVASVAKHLLHPTSEKRWFNSLDAALNAYDANGTNAHIGG